MPEYVITEEHVDSIVLHPENPNRGSVDEIRQSIRRFGWVGLVVGQSSTGRLLVGENRLTAAKAEGVQYVPVLWVDFDDDQAARYLVASNVTRQLAHIDDAKLLEALQSLEFLEGTGFSQADLDNLADALKPTGFGQSDDDDTGPESSGGATQNSTVVCKVGPYQFTVDADVYNNFYEFFMDSSFDLASATEAVAERLGFDPC